VAGSSLDSELELKRNRVAVQADELEILGQVRDEMLSDPDRALGVFARVRRATGIRKPAAFAVRLWQTKTPAPTTPATPEPELELGPPTLAALEFHWSRDDAGQVPPSLTPWHDALGRAMAAAIGSHGGCTALKP